MLESDKIEQETSGTPMTLRSRSGSNKKPKYFIYENIAFQTIE